MERALSPIRYARESWGDPDFRPARGFRMDPQDMSCGSVSQTSPPLLLAELARQCQKCFKPVMAFLQSMQDDFAVRHGGLNPAQLTWHRADQWDGAHANGDEIFDREADPEGIRTAHELDKAGDLSAAIDIWRTLAAQGSVWSMLELARCHEEGCGVEFDLAEAENWYKRAFAGGSQLAMLACAKAAARRKDYTACEAILQVGMNQNWIPAIFWLAWYRHKQSPSRKTYRAILPLLLDAAQHGYPAAQMVLANFTVRGKFGLLRLPLAVPYAVRWIRGGMADSDAASA